MGLKPTTMMMRSGRIDVVEGQGAKKAALAAILLVCLLHVGCSPVHVTHASVTGLPESVVVKAHPWYETSHHGDGVFKNPGEMEPKLSGLEIANWIITRRALPRLLWQRERVRTPTIPLDVAGLRERPEHFRATWLGHATLFMQTQDIDLIIDPVFAQTVGPVPIFGPDRRIELPLAATDLPSVDVVLISHDHYDHLDSAAVATLAKTFDPVFLVPLGVGSYVREWGARRVVELDWWQYVDLRFERGKYRFTGTPAVHNSGRNIGGQDRTLWAGWHIERQAAGLERALSFYYAGDTAYGDHFAEIRARLGAPDVTIMPIGAYEPRRFTGQFHVNPAEAIAAFLDLGGAEVPASRRTRALIPVHWGTFELTDEPMIEPPFRLLNAANAVGVGDRIELLPIGGQFEWWPSR